MPTSLPTPPTPRRGPRRAAGALVAGALLLAACGGDDGDGGAPAAGPDAPAEAQPLVIYNSYTIASLDPIQSGTNWLFDWAVAENLMQVDEDGEVQPWLAESLSQVDPMTWRVALREGVTFQNGDPLDGTAVARALNRQIERSRAAQVYLPAGSTAAATGPLEVTITTPAPNAMVPAGLAARDNSLQIYDVDVMEAAAGDSSKIVGQGAYTGPYAITAWTPDRLETVRHDGYWAGEPALPSVTVQVVPDEQARVTGAQTGEAGLAFYPAIESVLALEGRDDAELLASPEALQALLIDMNLRDAPFDDVAVRRAFTKAIDYEQLAQEVTGGVFETASGLYPDGMSYAAANQETDVDEAIELLEDAGWEEGPDGVRTKGGQPLEVVFVTQAQGPETTTLAIAIQAQVREAGFDLEILTAEDSAQTKSDPTAWDSSIGLNGSLSGTADPIQPFQTRWTTGGSANQQGLSDPEIDAMGQQLRQAFDPEERDELLRRAQEILVEEQAYVVAGTFKRFLVVAGPEWSGYEVSNVRRHLRYDTAP